MRRVSLTRDEVQAPPDGFDAVAHVALSIASVPWKWTAEVVLASAAGRIPPTLAELADAGGRTILRIRVESLDWRAGVLAGLGCDFTIVEPPELVDSVASLSRRLAAQIS